MRIKARKPIFDFRKENIFQIFFKHFKVPLLGNGGVHSNGAHKQTTRSWYEPTSQVSSKSVDSWPPELSITYKQTDIQTDGKPETKGSLTTTQQTYRHTDTTKIVVTAGAREPKITLCACLAVKQN